MAGDRACLFTLSSALSRFLVKKRHFAMSCFGSTNLHAPSLVVLRIDVFESVREPLVFAVYSEWVDEAAFETHATLSHTLRFLAAAETLLPHPVRGLRLRHIGGGAATGHG